MNDGPTMWNFGQLESVLATIHGIVPNKRTAFQARLKNLNRLGLPTGLEMRKGKATLYGVGEIIEMALAVEMTQLGLSPERVEDLIGSTYHSIGMAVGMAARDLEESPDGFTSSAKIDPRAIFLYFDPTALRSQTGPIQRQDGPDYFPDQARDSFGYGDEEIVRKYLVRWTSTSAPRISLINVTSMLDVLASGVGDTDALLEKRREFFSEMAAWAGALNQRFLAVRTGPKVGLWLHFSDELAPDFNLSEVDSLVELYSRGMGLPVELVREALMEFRDGKEPF